MTMHSCPSYTAHSNKEVEESQDEDQPFPCLGQDIHLDHQWLNLRASTGGVPIIS